MSDDDGIWLPPGSSGGKADGVQILKAADIPSQYVQSGKHYLASRRIDTLEQVGALKATEDMLAKRADGIIANLPANGRLDAAELVRMENPQIFATLFPDEQAALPNLWPLLLAPTPNAGSVTVPTNNLNVTEQVTQPGGLTEPTSLQISTLPTEMQTVARRVELVFNGDSNANTIQVADIDKVLADPQAFTPAEVQQLQQIKAIFHERATSVEEAKAVMPTPGHGTKTTTFGQSSLELTSDVVLHEQRALRTDYYGLVGWQGHLTLELTLRTILHAPPGDKIVMIELDNANEVILDGGDVSLGQLAAGDFILERYTQGARQSTHDVAFPPYKVGETTTDLSNYLDFKLVTANNTPLVRSAYNYTNANYWQTVDFHYDTISNPNAAISQQVIDQVDTPKSGLPTGRYEVPTTYGVLSIDLFPQGAVMARLGGVNPVHLLPNTIGRQKALTDATSSPYVSFLPENNSLQWNGGSFVLTAAQRTK